MKTNHQNLAPSTASVPYSFLEKRHNDYTRRWPWIILVAICVSLLLTSCLQEAPKVKIYPAPDGIELSQAFIVEVEGNAVPVYKTKIPPSEPIPRLNHSRSEFGFASFASFDMSEKVEIKVTYPEAVNSVKVLPSSFAIEPNIDGNNVVITLDEPKNLTIEVNGDWHESLHIFANPFEEDIPAFDDPNVVYFGPGIHDVTSVVVGDSTTVYIAGGAYLRCGSDPAEEEVELRGNVLLDGKPVVAEQVTLNDFVKGVRLK